MQNRAQKVVKNLLRFPEHEKFSVLQGTAVQPTTATLRLVPGTVALDLPGLYSNRGELGGGATHGVL